MIPRGAHFSPGDRFLRELDGTYQFCVHVYYSTVGADMQEDFYTEINFVLLKINFPGFGQGNQFSEEPSRKPHQTV